MYFQRYIHTLFTVLRIFSTRSRTVAATASRSMSELDHWAWPVSLGVAGVTAKHMQNCGRKIWLQRRNNSMRFTVLVYISIRRMRLDIEKLKLLVIENRHGCILMYNTLCAAFRRMHLKHMHVCAYIVCTTIFLSDLPHSSFNFFLSCIFHTHAHSHRTSNRTFALAFSISRIWSL